MTARVVPLRPGGGELDTAMHAARTALERHLGRAAMSPRTVAAYRRQAAAYLAWLKAHAADHQDAFVDVVGAEGAVAAWRRSLLEARLSPTTVNQGLAAAKLLYQVGAHLRISVKRARVAKPGAPDALSRADEGRLRRAADRRGPRDAAIVALLLGTGARVAECARLDLVDVTVTARTGTARLHGKGDQVRTVPVPGPVRERIPDWLAAREQLLAARPDLAGSAGGALWVGKRGRLTTDGITDVVRAAGDDAGLPGLRPHRLRHTCATRLREGGADPAVIQALLGHASLDTTARYFRASDAEVAAAVEAALDY